MIDQGQFRQLLVYDGMVLNASHQQTVPLLDLRDHYEFLYMATAREQEWVDFLWGNLEFFDPEYNDDVYVPGPGVLNFE